MNVVGWLLWGFVATLTMTALMTAAQAARWTRMSLPYLLGTMFTPDRDRAVLIGFLVHLVNGWLLALIYAAAFRSWNLATWWAGAGIGVVHALFVLTIGMALLPALHPRMANEQQGPTVRRQIEPPGFLALHYGFQTPLSLLAGHLVFGALFGAFYRL
jgi:uncharacterized membrane protein YagU involved in acid resistance